MLFRLLKIHLKNLYSPDVFFEGFKKGIKSVIKNIFIMIFIIYMLVLFIGMLVGMAKGSYASLEQMGQAHLMPQVAVMVASIGILFFGFTSVATSYYTGAGEEQFHAMPLSPRDIFGAKFALSFITDTVLGIFIFVIFSIVYGINQGLFKNPLFYMGLLVSAGSFSLLIEIAIYAALILILVLVPALRKKSFLTAVASILLVVFIMTYSLLSGRTAGAMAATLDESSGFSEGIGASFMPLAARLIPVAQNMPFLQFISGALEGKIIPILVLLALSAAIIFVCIPLLSKPYIHTLKGFSDVKAVSFTKKNARKAISQAKTNTAFKALLIRDVRTVFREPTFFVNGPLFVFLLPLVLIFSFTVPFLITEHIDLGGLVQNVRQAYFLMEPEKLQKICYYVCLGVSAFAFFCGTGCNVAGSAFSREGKSLANLKAMPLSYETLLKVKFFHSLLYVIAVNVFFWVIFIVLNCMFGFLIPWSVIFKSLFLIALLTITASIPLIFADLFLDTANPKLVWENPAAAFKQNFNALIGMFFSMIIIAIFVGLGIALPAKEISLVVISAFFVAVGAPLGSAYFRYGVKKLYIM